MEPPAPPRLETDRLILRPPAPGDAPALAAFVTAQREFTRALSPTRDPGYFTEEFWRGEVDRLEEERRAGRGLVLLGFLREAPGGVASRVSLSNIVRGAFHACHLGYEVREDLQGKGLMAEALRAVIAHAFGEMNLHRVQANYMPSNERSGRLLERLGFEVEGRARAYLRIAGRWEDHVLTSRVNPDWREPG